MLDFIMNNYIAILSIVSLIIVLFVYLKRGEENEELSKIIDLLIDIIANEQDVNISDQELEQYRDMLEEKKEEEEEEYNE